MNCARLLCLAAAALCCVATASAGTVYTFGGDFVSPGANGTPDSLNSMNPASSASVANVQTPVGDGSIGFNGGLVAFNNLLYAVGNDSSGVATLYSMQTNGSGLTAVSSGFNNSGDAAGVVFQNGLAAVSGSFYAIGAGAGSEALYQIQSGTATLVAGLNTFNGTYAGFAWDSSLAEFYAVIAGADSGDLLVSFDLSGNVTLITNLTNLDASQPGTHLGGLADAGSGILYDIYTDPGTFTGQLEQIDVNAGPSAATLYDTGVPLAQNAGVAILSPATSVPEPSTAFGLAGALILLPFLRRKRF